MTTKKTNACRQLDRLGIVYTLRSYEVDEADLSTRNVAQKLGVPEAQLWKTLCVRADDRAVLLAVLPGDCELDLKALARAARKKSVAPVALRELTHLTGYIRGGVTALACQKPYPVFLDSRAVRSAELWVSAGQRGLQIVLASLDYVRATSATLSEFATERANDAPR